MANNTVENVRERMQRGLKSIYASNTDPEFDAVPVAFIGKTDGDLVVVAIPDAHPAEVVPGLVAALDPDIVGLITPGWTKDPSGTMRIGENVTMLIETRDAQELYIYDVNREPLPVLGEPLKADHAAGRLTGFLYHRTEH